MGTLMDRAATFEAVMALLLIFLCAVLVTCVINGPTEREGNWSIASVNATPYMYTDNDGRLYMFDVVQDGTDIYALSQNGRIEWSYKVAGPLVAVNALGRRTEFIQTRPDAFQMGTQFDIRPVFAVDNGTMYLFLREGYPGVRFGSPEAFGYEGVSSGSPEAIIAISGGRKLWERELTHILLGLEYKDAMVQVSGDRLYVYHAYLLEVYGTNGTFLYSIPNVSDPPALDDAGNIYLMRAGENPDLKIMEAAGVLWDYNGLVPANTLESYAPDGALRWTAEIDGTPARQDVDRTAVPGGGDIPLYDGGMLYVPLDKGIAALDTDGNVLWNADVGDNVTLLRTMPFGVDGTIYMERDTEYHPLGNRTPVIYLISPDGSFTAMQPPSTDADLLAAAQGTGYFGHGQYEEDYLAGVDRLLTANITAVDMGTGSTIWEREIAPAGKKTVVADRQNVMRLFEYSQTAFNTIGYSEDHPELLDMSGLFFATLGNYRLNVLEAGDVIYVGYYMYNYEHPEGYWTGTTFTPFNVYSSSENSAFICPALLGRSRICYASGVIALDRDGRILWDKPVDSMLTGIAADNATIFFGTRDGGLSAVRSDVALGATLIAALYMFLRFFMVGAVARARSRINDNANRNMVLDLIRREPGATMYEIARRLGMNTGTVRYHLFILGINHRIVTYRDGKYVRYFGNANAYTEPERAMISLLRRDWARKLFAALQESGGMSNVRLAQALGVSEPAVSSYLRELVNKDVITREVGKDGSVRYSVRDECRKTVMSTIERMPVPVGK